MLDGVTATAEFRGEAVMQLLVVDEGGSRGDSEGEGVGFTVDLDGKGSCHCGDVKDSRGITLFVA